MAGGSASAPPRVRGRAGWGIVLPRPESSFLVIFAFCSIASTVSVSGSVASAARSIRRCAASSRPWISTRAGGGVEMLIVERALVNRFQLAEQHVGRPAGFGGGFPPGFRRCAPGCAAASAADSRNWPPKAPHIPRYAPRRSPPARPRTRDRTAPADASSRGDHGAWHILLNVRMIVLKKGKYTIFAGLSRAAGVGRSQFEISKFFRSGSRCASKWL